MMDRLQQILNILNSAKEVITSLNNTIEIQSDTINNLNKVISLKDQVIDQQLQMLQLMELKLREFGFKFDASPLI